MEVLKDKDVAPRATFIVSKCLFCWRFALYQLFSDPAGLKHQHFQKFPNVHGA
jgi:hypothetical protein